MGVVGIEALQRIRGIAVSNKAKMTVTSRFMLEKKPLSTQHIPTVILKPGQRLRVRLSAMHTEKMAWEYARLTAEIRGPAAEQCIFVPDTNFFTSPMEDSVWQALQDRHVLVLPGVWSELKPWRENPIRNASLRDLIVQLGKTEPSGSSGSAVVRTQRGRFELMKTVSQQYKHHAYRYYFNLLAVRKWMGTLTDGVLEARLGRRATDDEFLAEIHGVYGERGYLLAKKARDNPRSINLLNDEQLVVMAVQTGIMRSTNVVILTRDRDVQEQFVKMNSHLKEHYRCMLAAEKYAADPDRMPFRPVVANSGWNRPDFFEADTLLSWETTESSFDVLPPRFKPIDATCMLFGGGVDDLKLTISKYCREAEMVRLLKLKSVSNGLSTDKLDGRNCIIETAPGTGNDDHRVIVHIGREKRIRIGPAEFNATDLYNSLTCNERVTRYADVSQASD